MSPDDALYHCPKCGDPVSWPHMLCRWCAGPDEPPERDTYDPFELPDTPEPDDMQYGGGSCGDDDEEEGT